MKNNINKTIKKIDNIHSVRIQAGSEPWEKKKKKKDPNIAVSLGQSEYVLIPITFEKCFSV